MPIAGSPHQGTLPRYPTGNIFCGICQWKSFCNSRGNLRCISKWQQFRSISAGAFRPLDEQTGQAPQHQAAGCGEALVRVLGGAWERTLEGVEALFDHNRTGGFCCMRRPWPGYNFRTTGNSCQIHYWLYKRLLGLGPRWYGD